MGLFDKKICDICGEKIGLLGNRKLDDGNLCKDCAKKLSPWFEERRHSTVEDIKRQLEYREKNKKAVMDFCITRQINTRNYNVFIDDNKGNFTVARKLDVNENPDIVPLSAIVQCRVDVDQQQQEETYTKDGETVSYQPPVYKYEFDYTMRIKVRTQWFDDMDFRLNTFSISSDNRRELMEVEQTAYQIIAALTPNAAGNAARNARNEHEWRDAARNAGNEHERRNAAWDAGNEHERRDAVWDARDEYECGNAARDVRNEHECGNAAWNDRDEHERRDAVWDARDEHECGNAARDARNEYERRDAVWDAGNEHERRNAAWDVGNEHERRNAADGNVRNEHDRRNATE